VGWLGGGAGEARLAAARGRAGSGGRGVALDDEGAGDQVVQGLLARGEGGHQVADEQQQEGQDLEHVAQQRAPEAQAPAGQVRDADAHGELARGGLQRGGFED
jgi:hypothetical protein